MSASPNWVTSSAAGVFSQNPYNPQTPTPRRWRHPISYYRDRAEAQGWTVGPLERGGIEGDQPDRLDLELTKEVAGHVQHIRVGVRRVGDRGLLFLDGAIDDVELCPAD